MMWQSWACAVGGLLGRGKARPCRHSRLQAHRGLCLPASAGGVQLPQMLLRCLNGQDEPQKARQGCAQQSTVAWTLFFLTAAIVCHPISDAAKAD